MESIPSSADDEDLNNCDNLNTEEEKKADVKLDDDLFSPNLETDYFNQAVH